jgi:hypothetical protein
LSGFRIAARETDQGTTRKNCARRWRGRSSTNRDNGVGADVLPHLTADDLKELGVASIGDRRRLLVAIAVLAGGGPPAGAAASPSKRAPPKPLGRRIARARDP